MRQILGRFAWYVCLGCVGCSFWASPRTTTQAPVSDASGSDAGAFRGYSDAGSFYDDCVKRESSKDYVINVANTQHTDVATLVHNMCIDLEKAQ